MQVYELAGSNAEVSFAKSWAQATAMDQAQQWSDVFKASGMTILMVLLYEHAHIISNRRWIEEHCDTLSVHATMFTGMSTTWWQRVQTHLRFYHRVT